MPEGESDGEVLEIGKTSDRRFFGDYELLEELARGGMGIVFRAHQASLDRVVAVKIVNSAGLQSPSARMRFQVEAEAIASLDHPNIVSLYESGEHDGQLFYSMPFVAGGNLLEALEEDSTTTKERVRLLAKVARAVQHAHSAGVLHRDLKPSNILLDEGGEPYLADFGLAKLADVEGDFTQTQTVLGSPNYMAPEQASEAKAVTTSADVYSLGAILYQMLTGLPPFRAETILETMHQLAHDPPTRPSQHTTVSADLEVVCLKCLEKDPARRYPSAGALADELELWLSGQPVRARRVGPAGRLWRWAQRQPALAAALSLVACLLVGVAIVSSLATLRVQKAQGETSALLYEMQLSKVDELHEKGNVSEAIALLAKLSRDRPEDTLLHLRLSNLLSYTPLSVSSAPRIYFGPGRKITAMQLLGENLAHVVCSDGMVYQVDQAEGTIAQSIFDTGVEAPRERVALAKTSLDLAVAEANGLIAVFDRQGRPRCEPFEAPGRVHQIALSADGTRLAAAHSRNHVTLWGLPDGKLIGESTAGRGVSLLEFDQRGRFLMLGGFPEGAQLWRTEDGTLVQRFKDRENAYIDGEISSDGSTIAFADARGAVVVWDIDTQRRLDDRFTHGHRTNGVRFSPDGAHLLSFSGDRTARLWDIRRRRPGPVLQHAEFVTDGTFTKEGTSVVTSSKDGTVQFWNAVTGERVGEPLVHRVGVDKVYLGDDAEDIRSVCYDGTLWKWQKGQASTPATLLDLSWLVGATAMSPDRSLLAVGSKRSARHRNKVHLMDTRTLESVAQPIAIGDAVVAIAFNHDSSLLAIAAGEKVVIYDRSAAKVIRKIPFSSVVSAMSFTAPDSLAIAPAFEPVWIGDVRDSQAEPQRLPKFAYDVEFIPSKSGRPRQLLTATDKGAVMLWNLDIENPTSSEINRTRSFARVSPQADVIGIAANNSRFWSLRSGQMLAGQLDHFGSVESMCFTADGSHVASGSSDKTAWIARLSHDAVEPLHHLSHTSSVKALSISANDRLLATGTNNARMRLWDLQSGRPLTEPLDSHTPVAAIYFGDEDTRMITVSVTGMVLSQPLPPAPSFASEWLPELGEYLARRKADDLGRAQALRSSEIQERTLLLKAALSKYPNEPLLRHFIEAD